ncbi:hypothetical protein [Arundinibacter roseus]|uniref:Uncharacterized protein n=1 Tax=Arundinibacter roseus TaxID=2070510 RepID=A0A4R4KJI6_9BACT|nr:hypothetical protein [Arundinibacter roseus]TDB68113.1 hypothetical protein EZE20_04100 [Arundinibacter roseus]
MTDFPKFKLVEGTFVPAEATRVMCDLIHSKINYHNLEILSAIERNLDTPVHSEQRIEELIRFKNELKVLLDKAESMHMKLKIDGVISITLTS